MDQTKLLTVKPWSINSTLGQTLASTFEAFAFEEPYPDQTPIKMEAEYTSIRIDVLLPDSGSMILMMLPDTARELSMQISGLDAEELSDPSQITDAIGELANVLTGKLIRNSMGRNTAFQLGLPLIVEGIPLDWEESTAYSMILSCGTVHTLLFGLLNTNSTN